MVCSAYALTIIHSVLLGCLDAQAVLSEAVLQDAEIRQSATGALEAARSAAELHASLAAQRSGSGTGEMLRCNFVVLADLVFKQDAHLLSDAEKDMIAHFKVASTAPACVW
jgi:hypothetical protein